MRLDDLEDHARLVVALASLALVVLVQVLQFAGKGQLGITLALCALAWELLELAQWRA